MATVHAHMRLPAELVAEAKGKAAGEHATLTAVVVQLLAGWVAGDIRLGASSAPVPAAATPRPRRATERPGRTAR